MLIGELLVQKGLIRKSQLDIALAEQKKTGEFLGAVLNRLGFLQEEDLLKALSEQFELPYVALKTQYVDWPLVLRFSPSLVVDRRVFPYKTDKGTVVAALSNPLDVDAISQLESEASPLGIKVVLTASADLNQAIAAYKEHMADRAKKLL
jgi:type IV pilus assembly protein PilB